MYTVMIGDDGMFSAEYVVPPALSIPLGTSGSAVDVVRNEDGTFSANGEVITAETMVTAANGNVYAAVLSPEGVPVGVMHVAAMQDVMLGDLGGTVKLTQAEDKSWWLGEMAVMDGYVHTHENGNMYALMMDAEGMWSAMYQKVEVMVDLGTQGPVTLERAEDMSWWLGTEAVDDGSDVNSPNGNRYTLWYTDGVWSARFEAESMMIEGTGLMAMTREGDDMYDVGDSTLPSTGAGDVMDGDAMYHVWMDDGKLMGARFDAAIDAGNHTRRKTYTGPLANPFLSADDPDTPGNELRTHIVATGNADTGEGMFSFGALLGSGTASDEGKLFVVEAVEEIEDVQAYISAVLALDDPLAELDEVLKTQWSRLNRALDHIFATDSDNSNPDDVTSAVDTRTPREDDILGEIDDILDALSSESSFVAATAKDGGGVFETQELNADQAADAFNRLRWSAEATLGMTGSTRYGTVARKATDYARNTLKLDNADGAYGAFSYSTMQETLRSADAAALSPTGIARYSGGTRAVSGSGKAYSGMMDLEVRFNVNAVSGVVSGLEDADGLPWRHNFADVSQIVLTDAKLLRNATWNLPSASDGTVFYTRDSGRLRPNLINNTFAGILLGRGANAGSEASGVWSVGTRTTSSNYLTGGFGVEHVADVPRPVPSGDDVSEAAAKLITTQPGAAQGDAQATNQPMASIKDGQLTVTGRKFGWAGRDGTTAPTYQALSADDENVKITATFDLATLAGNNGAPETVKGDTWVSGVISILTRERDLLSTLQGLKALNTGNAEISSWQRVQDALQYNLFGENGELPAKFDVLYATDDTDAAYLDSEADAIDLIDEALDALSSAAKLEAALDPDGKGIFSHYNTDTGDPGYYIAYDTGRDRRFEFYSGLQGEEGNATALANNSRTIGNFLGEREHQVIAAMGTTDFTRFGVWRREDTSSARRRDGGTNLDEIRTHGGPGTFAYSPLDPTNVGTLRNLAFPVAGRATYTGETIAIQNTTILTGTARVDVGWTNTTPTNLNADTQLGTMSLTISDLASATGDPLTHGGSGSSAGDEIADIVFPGISIMVGDANGGFESKMIAGAKGEADDDGKFLYIEQPVSDVRYRLTIGGPDEDASSANAGKVKALFMGQGVDGPLGVIGTWTLSDENVARINAAGTKVADPGAAIHGAFGVEAP